MAARIEIVGCPAFYRATVAALDHLYRTRFWSDYVVYLRRIEQGPNEKIVGGWVLNGVFTVCTNMWRASSRVYASGIVHEGCHMKYGDLYSTDANEARAIRAENEFRRTQWCMRLKSERTDHHHRWRRELERRRGYAFQFQY